MIGARIGNYSFVRELRVGVSSGSSGALGENQTASNTALESNTGNKSQFSRKKSHFPVLLGVAVVAAPSTIINTVLGIN